MQCHCVSGFALTRLFVVNQQSVAEGGVITWLGGQLWLLVGDEELLGPTGAPARGGGNFWRGAERCGAGGGAHREKTFRGKNFLKIIPV